MCVVMMRGWHLHRQKARVNLTIPLKIKPKGNQEKEIGSLRNHTVGGFFIYE